MRWRIPDRRSVAAVIRALERDGVRDAQPNYLYEQQQDSEGSHGGDPAQYAVGKLHLREAHQLARGDNVRIAIINSAIDSGHPEIAPSIVGRFVPAGFDDAPDRHGTAVAGTIVAHAHLLGVAPTAQILAADVFGEAGPLARATTFNVIAGLDWAARENARIINMSFAGPRDPVIGRTLAAAHHRGIVLIAAAGNAGPTSAPLYPAADPHVIAVAATDSLDHVFAQSVRGRYISIAAPGVDILAPAPRRAYQIISGTSLSAAYVSGLAALLIEREPHLSPDGVRQRLQQSAHDLGPPGPDSEFGAGLADAYRALRIGLSSTATPALSRR